MSRSILLLGSFVIVGGCAALIGIEPTATLEGITEGGADAFVARDGASDAEDAEAGIDVPDGESLPPETDAGADADAGPPCAVVTPTAFNVVPPGVVGDVCSPEGVLGPGAAGLGIHGAGVFNVPDNQAAITSCVGVDFKTLDLASVKVRLWSKDKPCLYSCYGGGCIGQAVAKYFVGPSKDPATWKSDGFSKLIGPNAVNLVPVAIPYAGYHFFFVCRNASGAEYDGVMVDTITATSCR